MQLRPHVRAHRHRFDCAKRAPRRASSPRLNTCDCKDTQMNLVLITSAVQLDSKWPPGHWTGFAVIDHR